MLIAPIRLGVFPNYLSLIFFFFIKIKKGKHNHFHLNAACNFILLNIKNLKNKQIEKKEIGNL